LGCLRLDILDEHYYGEQRRSNVFLQQGEALKNHERSEYLCAENRRTGATVSEANVIFSAKHFSFASFSFVATKENEGEKNFGYDAWGRRYRYDDGNGWGPPHYFYFDEHPSHFYSSLEILNYFTRGYTGHEHLDMFGLINMNGRMYDPMIARFLSPDPYVQMPDFTQSFNRYSYCINNPLSYTDPTGEIFKKIWKGIQQLAYVFMVAIIFAVLLIPPAVLIGGLSSINPLLGLAGVPVAIGAFILGVEILNEINKHWNPFP
jgi:RHS repeat-associated protein